jgi:hypothetical protein
MPTIQQGTDPNLFEVILYFEGDSWSFSTFARASIMQEALEHAEREFSVHSFHHQLGDMRVKATSAYVIHASDDHSFAKRDGKWQLMH